ncbi:MAG: epoxyqueuosine reductase QueH [Clostridia bacterium]|nr:epoxyqueuosine reductase QueH [Clostridia bacterium]
MEKKKLLLHSCCGPCSTSVIEKLQNDYDLTIFYYNPNIYPEDEYIKRLSEQKKYIELTHKKIKVIDGEYADADKFMQAYTGLENCCEGGERCKTCIYLRLKKTAEFASKNKYDIFASTLSVSPHKNAKLINDLGLELSKENNIEYLISDFKKQDGYLNSIKLSKQYNLYRQNYCGCKYSIY